MRMKKIGLFGVAVATTLIGDVRLAPAVGLETVRGKSFDPVPQSTVDGSCAAGAGKLLVLGVQLMETGGVEGYEGCVGGGVGLGMGVGAGAGDVFESLPQPDKIRLSVNRANNKPTYRWQQR